MKIKTKNKQERNWNVTCENCKKEYIVEEKDVTAIFTCQSYKLYLCKCPCCGKRDYVREEKF